MNSEETSHAYERVDFKQRFNHEALIIRVRKKEFGSDSCDFQSKKIGLVGGERNLENLLP